MVYRDLAQLLGGFHLHYRLGAHLLKLLGIGLFKVCNTEQKIIVYNHIQLHALVLILAGLLVIVSDALIVDRFLSHEVILGQEVDKLWLLHLNVVFAFGFLGKV